MKRDRLERELLLEQSGELSGRRKKRLERILAADPEARRLRDEWQRLIHAARESAPPPKSDPCFTRRLTQEARRLKTAREPRRFRPMWQPAFAYAAAAVLLASFGLLWLRSAAPSSRQLARQPSPVQPQAQTSADWDDGVDEQLEEIEQLFVMIQDDSSDPFSDKASASDTDLNDMAHELLQLEETRI